MKKHLHFSSFVLAYVFAGFLAAAQAFAANWHVDASAAGNNSGQNWTDAWTNLTSINWTGIKPGDTILVSRGTYPEPLLIGTSGTPDAPITIALGNDSKHSGKVTVNGINIGRHEWITINGALNKNFAPPTHILNLRDITNNIGIFCSNNNGTAIYMTNPNGIELLWVSVSQALRGTTKAAHGIWANVTRRGPTDHNLIKYCWIKDVDDDGIAWIGNASATHFGHQEVAFSIIEYVGDDGLEANSGFSVHDCLLGPSRFKHGHPDGIQSQGSYWKIYNNEFQDFLNSWIRAQAVDLLHHDVWIYNNLFLSGKRMDGVAPLSNTGIEVVQYAAHIGELPSMTWSNIIIANNTFFNAVKIPGQAINWAKRDERTASAFVHNVFVTDSKVVNNLFIDCARGASANWQPVMQAAPWGRGVHYASENDLVWDYNVASGFAAKNSTRVGYFGQEYGSGEAMAKRSVWKNNSSGRVSFVAMDQWDLRLNSNDTTARGTGTNLTHIFSHDILNQPRSADKTWNRGAFGH